MSLSKSKLPVIIAQTLQAELARSLAAAREAAAGATDEQNKAESKYDTRGLELSYLAAGQGRLIAELESALDYFRAMEVRAFGATEVVAMGALVTVESGSGRRREEAVYFLAPKAGGTEVCVDGKTVMVITPKSPLGQQLIGRRAGDSFTMGGEQRILSVE